MFCGSRLLTLINLVWNVFHTITNMTNGQNIEVISREFVTETVGMEKVHVSRWLIVMYN
jgi:hypothetical protein